MFEAESTIKKIQNDLGFQVILYFLILLSTDLFLVYPDNKGKQCFTIPEITFIE